MALERRIEMEFKSIMHISFYTEHFDEMRNFYENKLGLKPKIVTKAKTYKGLNRGLFSEIAEIDPERVIIMYLELAPGQFIELFPKEKGTIENNENKENNKMQQYSHFALLVDDIVKTRDEFIERGIEIDTDIAKGPSETYQMWLHDPDGNRFEVMQYTENSYQVVGHIQ